MRYYLSLYTLLLFFFLSACNGGKHKKADEKSNAVKFTTSDASELFFRNVRAIQYDKTVMEEAKLDIYRINERLDVEDRPILNLAIVVNWRYDEAYILTEPNTYLQSLDTLRIIWQDTVAQDSGTYTFSEGNKTDHFQLASQIYSSIQKQQTLFVMIDKQKIPFMRRRDEKEAFRKTMVDYLRLVDLL